MDVLRKQSVVDLATTSIIDYICSGEFKVGDKLPTEKAMTLRLGISRSALRESYGRLQVKGFISIENGRGAFVKSIDRNLTDDPLVWFKEHRAQMQDYLEVRLSLDPLVARHAARNRTESDIKELTDINKEFEEAYSRLDGSTMARMDAAFHNKIADISRNELLGALIKTVNSYCAPLRAQSLSVEEHASHAILPHRNIVAAIVAGDEKAAEKASYEHIVQAFHDVCGVDL